MAHRQRDLIICRHLRGKSSMSPARATPSSRRWLWRMRRARQWKNAQRWRIMPPASSSESSAPRRSRAPNFSLTLWTAMRILQVNSSSACGGGETHVQQLTEVLRKRGHDVAISGRPRSRLKPEIELPFLNSADFVTALRLRSRIAASSFDIVHAHVARDYSIVAAALLRLRKPKLVLTRHLLLPIRAHFLYQRVDAWITPTAQIMNTLAGFSRKTAAVHPNWGDVHQITYAPHALPQPLTVGLL